MKHFILLVFVFLAYFPTNIASKRIITGDERTELYFNLIKNKRIALYSNHTGIAHKKHVVDLLIEKHMNVVAIFSPEHGFRGNADAGEHVGNSIDEKTGIPIISLYNGNNNENFGNNFDILLIDIQDVGLRFYTYYITMWRLMNACAKYDKQVIVLDRPNPNGFYVDGPILDLNYRSGVGWLPIPIVHGMTLGELAQMINGEKWLDNRKECKLKVIPCSNYRHSKSVKLQVPPSPNLSNMKSIYLYPSTCFFEGTIISLGRGTDKPFQIYGHPDMKNCSFSFTPQSIPGAKNPPLLGKKCLGKDISNVSNKIIKKQGINLEYIIDAYNNLNIGESFFTNFFDKLAGCKYIRKMIINGVSASEIKATWKEDVAKFKKQREPYMLYK